MFCEMRWDLMYKEEAMKIVHISRGGQLTPCVVNYVAVNTNAELIMNYRYPEKLCSKSAQKEIESDS